MANPPPNPNRAPRRPTILGILVLLAVGFMLAGAAYTLLTIAGYANALSREDDPPVVILPPTLVYGSAALYGPRGCVKPGPIVTTIVGRNIAQLTFFHNGRRVKSIKSDTLGRRRYALVTRIARTDYSLHTVRVRIRFVDGAIPTGKTLRHRFVQCRTTAVSG